MRVLRLSATATGWTFATILVRRGCTGFRGRASNNSVAIFFVETGGCNGFFRVSGVTTTLSAGFLASVVVSVVALIDTFCGVGWVIDIVGLFLCQQIMLTSLTKLSSSSKRIVDLTYDNRSAKNKEFLCVSMDLSVASRPFPHKLLGEKLLAD